MKMDETVKMTFPHNLPNGELSVNKIKKMINTARELGGTVYNVAADSGLLSAFHFMELLFDEAVTGEVIMPQHMTVVTEVFVKYSQTEELERIFLYSRNAARDDELIKEGCIEDGKLIIAYDRLKFLHDKGYRCYYQRADENSGLSSNRFKEVFGNDQQRITFHLWDSEFCFVGCGFNQALFVKTMFETAFVMPDIYAVEQSIKAVYAEKIIRERYEPAFSLERVGWDRSVMEELENIRNTLFRRAKMQGEFRFSDSYRILTCQIAYIKVHYSDVYEMVWDDNFEMEDERRNINWDENEEVTLGISISESEGFYAVFRTKNGNIVRVPDMEYTFDTPLFQKYKFRGYLHLKSAGVAASRLALALKHIIQSAQFMFDITVKKVYITCVDGLPTKKEIQDFIEMRKSRLLRRNKNPEENLDVIAYQEITNKNIDGIGIINLAARLAGLSNYEYVEPVTAILNAFETFEKKNRLEKGERGLIYEMSEEWLVLTLVERKEDDSIEVIEQNARFGTVADGYYEEDELDCEEYNPNLDWVLGNSVTNFMMDAGLRALGIYGDNDNDNDAFTELVRSTGRVRRQLKRNEEAKVIFDNGYLNMMEEYPISHFENCYKPLLERNAKFLQEFISEADFEMKDIARIYLLGGEWEYPFARKFIKDFTNREVCCVAPFECVAARGAALMEKSKKKEAEE